MTPYNLETIRVIIQSFTVIFVVANFVMLIKQRNKSYEADILPVNFNFYLPVINGIGVRNFARKPVKEPKTTDTYPLKYKFDNIGQGVARDIRIKETYPFNFNEVIDYLFQQLKNLGYDHKYSVNDQRFRFEDDATNPLSTRDHILFTKVKEHTFDYQLTVKDSEASIRVPASKAFLFLILLSLYLFSRIRDKRKEFGFGNREYYNIEKEVWSQIRKMVMVQFSISFVDNLGRSRQSKFSMQLSDIPVIKELNGVNWVNVKLERGKL